MTGPIPWPTAPEEACPICARKAKPEVRPFCSTRCADIDLGRWLTDRYAIPTPEDEDEDAASEVGRDRST